ncbi:DNA-processing protein DprA [Proteiniclasticum sp. BAD-10]|uniref:DNA-processing protein DprA n=1 Tax=Proteiniclasticum sediminis TaxID=2804028 RepID=A0A941CPY4_9CLOT|nr:DNA-processing protein DprA [Proteiniclasticum sediminis]MBR0575479.1 DNA-processing protein DprA [Proteiniclasticum sediminis]
MERQFFEDLPREIRLMAAFHTMNYEAALKAMLSPPAFDREIREKILARQRANPRHILIGDKGYPPRLYDMTWPPLLLYYEGDIKLLHRPSVAVVGSRKCSTYGRRVTKDFSMLLAKSGMVVVSGGARGIDTVAHEAALEVQGKSICVLGCGLNVAYPPENRELFRVLAQEGLLLSEYPRDYGPKRWTFPMRNRIIAALSSAVLVTEAEEKSGSLHTAAYGEELNRPVYAVPGDIYAPNKSGTHGLIEMGARILYRQEDLLLDLLALHPEMARYRIKDLGLAGISMAEDTQKKLLGWSSFSRISGEEDLFVPDPPPSVGGVEGGTGKDSFDI